MSLWMDSILRQKLMSVATFKQTLALQSWYIRLLRSLLTVARLRFAPLY
ncbi:MAG: hypothetical protein V7K79_13375 [Nostoc sp.]